MKLTAWRNPVSGETAIYDEEQIKDIVDELTDGAFELIGERTVKKRRVYCGLLSGAEWLDDAPRDKCALSCAINGIHAAFHYLKKNYISGSVMTVPTG